MPRASAKSPQNLIKTNREFLNGLIDQMKVASVRPSINGYVPHAKQLIFHQSTARGKLFIGGNRSGKTVGGAAEAVMRLTGKHRFRDNLPPPPVRGRAIGVDFTDGIEKIMKPEIARWLPPSELINGSWEDSYDKQLRTLTLDNGSFIEFMSYEQLLEKFAGTSRHFIWMDEEPPEDIFIENKTRLIDTAGDWWITMTPVEGMTWVHDSLYEPGIKGTDPNILVVQVDMTENPALNMGEVEQFLSSLSEDDRKARKEGKFVELGGLVYKNFSDRHILDPFMPPLEWLHIGTMDHGFTNPTCWLWMAIDSEGRVFVYDEYYESGHVVSEVASAVHLRNVDHARVPDYYVGDPSIRNIDPITGTSILLEYTELGIPIILGNNDQKAGLNRVQSMLGKTITTPEGKVIPDPNKPQKLYISKKCPNLIWEMKRLRWATWATRKMRADKNKKEEQHKKNDHACDALRYGICSRPEVDTGNSSDLYRPIGINEETYRSSFTGVDSFDRVDTSLLKPTRRVATDYTLGEEW